jgi:hypothetical protein
MSVGFFAKMGLTGFILLSFAQMLERFDDGLTKINNHIHIQNSLLLCGHILAAEKNFLSASQNLSHEFPERSKKLSDAFAEISLRLQSLDGFHGMNRDDSSCHFVSESPWFVELKRQGSDEANSENYVMDFMREESL